MISLEEVRKQSFIILSSSYLRMRFAGRVDELTRAEYYGGKVGALFRAMFVHVSGAWPERKLIICRSIDPLCMKVTHGLALCIVV